MQRISSFHSPAEAQESAPIFSTHSNLEKNQTGKGISVPNGSQQLWKQVTVPKTAKSGVICTSWYRISAEQDNLDAVTVNPEGSRESCGDRDSTTPAPTNPGAAPAVALPPNHSSVPVSPVCPTGGDRHKILPQPSTGRKRQSSSLPGPSAENSHPTTVSQPLYPTGNFPLHRK